MTGLGGPKKPPAFGEKSTNQTSEPSAPKQVSAPQAKITGSKAGDRVREQARVIGSQNDHRGQSSDEFARDLQMKIGAEGLDSASLNGLSTQLLAEHLMILLANKRARQSRSEVLKEVADLLLGLTQKERINKILALMPQVGRIVDIYPLEVLIHILEREPECLSKHSFQPFVRNRDELHSRSYEVGASIEIKVPLALKMRSFALEGGGNPGYVFAPGPPGAYLVEFGAAGSYSLLLRGEIRKKSQIDRLMLQIHAANA